MAPAVLRALLILAVVGCGTSGGAPASTGGAGGEGGGETGGAGGATGGSGGQPRLDAAPDLAAPAADTAPAIDVSAPDRSAPPADAPPSTGPARIVLVAGGGSGGDGSPAVTAKLSEPFGTAVDPMTGDLYICEYTGGHVRRVDTKGIISTVVGAGASGPGGKVTLGMPHDVLFQPGTRTLFIADTYANRVVKMDAATGETTVFAGAGTTIAPTMVKTFHLAFDSTGEHLYVTDNGGGKVVIIDLKSNTTTSVNAGANIRSIAVDSKKNLYLSNNNAVLRKIDPAGAMSTVVSGLNAPKHLAVDADDNVVIADTEINVIKTWMPGAASAVKIAGTGAMGTGSLGGAPEQAAFNRPHGVSVDAQGRIYISDSDNNRVLRIER
jgi:DNA-binding beta-propeller fold protein YncE